MKLKNNQNNQNQRKTMNKHIKRNLGKIIIALSLIGFTAGIVLADNPTQLDHVTVVTATNPCAGKYYAYANMTNDAGSIWIKPPTNIVVTSGTLTDLSGFPAQYASYATVKKSGTTTFLCGSNNVTFPATNGASYQLMVVVTSPTPPPTNGESMTLHVDWH